MIRTADAATIFLLFCLILFPAGSGIAQNRYLPQINRNFIVINKPEQKLRVFDKDACVIAEYDVAVGTNYGDKKSAGDCRTPEGVFTIKSIEASQHYHYDFNDGRGLVKGAYGPRFIRLTVPGNNSIGIHGTLPEHQSTIPGRASHGCIRMKNNDVLELCKYVHKGMKVVIIPDMTETQMLQP